MFTFMLRQPYIGFETTALRLNRKGLFCVKLLIVSILCMFLTSSRLLGESGLSNYIDGVTVNAAGTNVYVGYSGSQNFLGIYNGGALTNSADGYLGFQNEARSNLVLITGTGSLWTNLFDVYVGKDGGWNNLVISNGGRYSSSTTKIGDAASSGNNKVILTGSGSSWNNSGIRLGISGASNTFQVLAGSRMDTPWIYLGKELGADNNHLEIQASSVGSVSEFRSVLVGVKGSNNRLTLRNGGSIAQISGYSGYMETVVGDEAVSSNNCLFITDPGSSWNFGSFDPHIVGNFGSANTMIISNGGNATDYRGYIGKQITASNNCLTITGTGSVWKIWADFYVGEAGSSNRTLITGGGLLDSGYENHIGTDVSSKNNDVVVEGNGSQMLVSRRILVGQKGSENQMIVRKGGFVQSGGLCVGGAASSSNNWALVTGNGSIWNSRFPVQIGSNGPLNRLVISDSGKLYTSNLVVGYGATATDNSLYVFDSGLGVTNSKAGGRFEVHRKGFFQLKDSSLITDNWIVDGNSRLALQGNINLLTRAANMDFGTNAFRLGETLGDKINWVMENGSHTVTSTQMIVGAAANTSASILLNGGMLNQKSLLSVGSNSFGYGVGSLVVSNADLSISKLVSGYAGTGAISNIGGVFLFNTLNYQIITNSPHSIVAVDAGVGFYGITNAPLVVNTDPIEWTGIKDRYRLRESTNAMTGAYTFGIGNPQGYKTLELMGSVWQSSSLTIGQEGTMRISGPLTTLLTSDRKLLISGGGKVYQTAGITGFNPDTSNFNITVEGSLWTSEGGDYAIGYNGGGNSLSLKTGAIALGRNTYVGYNWGSTNNQVSADLCSMISNSGAFYVGYSGMSNRLTLSTSSTLTSSNGYIGYNSHDNFVDITDAGSAWQCAGTLSVGYQGYRNTLLLENLGTVIATNVVLGFPSTSNGEAENFLKLNHTTVGITNAMKSAHLDLACQGILEIKDSRLIVDNLMVKNISKILVQDKSFLETYGLAVNFAVTNDFLLGSHDGGSLEWTLRGTNNVITARTVVGAEAGSSTLLTLDRGKVTFKGPLFVGSNAVGRGTGGMVISNGMVVASQITTGFKGTGSITNVNGIFMFNVPNPQIITNDLDSIVGYNAGVGFQGVSNAPVNLDLSMVQWGVSIRCYRLSSSTNVMVGPYVFGPSNPQGYQSLELVEGRSTWRSSSLLIEPGSSLFISNNIATVLGIVTNFGFSTSSGSRVSFNDNVVISGGSYAASISTNAFAGIFTAGPSATIPILERSTFAFGSNFVIQSTNPSFNMSLARIVFSSGTFGLISGRFSHTFDISGSKLTEVGSIPLENSFDTLTIANSHRLTITGSKTSTLTNALYIGRLEIQSIDTSSYSTITNRLATALILPDINVYYDKFAPGNGYLNGSEYNLWTGGRLIPHSARDPNGDGLPDDWQWLYFGSLTHPLGGPDADADGDGMTNLQEYYAGTHPLDVQSRLGMGNQGIVNGTNFTVTWQSVPNQSYRIQYSTNCLSWTNIGPTAVATFTNSSWTDDGTYTGGSPGLKQRIFYRVKIAP
jgi:T5SS/PEP-CTERM-associated repeat protein